MVELALQSPVTQGVYHLACQMTHRQTTCRIAPFIYHTNSNSGTVTLTPQRKWYVRYASYGYTGWYRYNDRYSYSQSICWDFGLIHLRHYDNDAKIMRKIIDKPNLTINGKRGAFTLSWDVYGQYNICFREPGIKSTCIDKYRFEITSVTFDGKHLSIQYKHRETGTIDFRKVCVR